MLKQQFLTSLTDSFVPFTGVGQAQYDAVGDIRVEAGGSGQAMFKFVKFTGTLASAIGDFVSYTDTTGQLVDATHAGSTGPAGVAQCAVVVSTPVFGWIQITGKATFNTPFAATTAGFKLTSAGAPNKTLVAAALVTDNHAAIALNATTIAQLTCPM